ncbi:MAG: PilZ domain-containing protein [Syntrophobacteraceae bacterium]
MEKRKNSRVSFNADVIVTSGDLTISGATDNLSMKGMFLTAERRLPADELMDIKIRLSGSELSIDLKGKTVRQTDAGMAIEFIAMDLDSFTHLKKLVAYNSGNADHVEDEYYQSVSPDDF